jgi:predicted AlkP superfamily phosphohydrolase/phosphomutase
MRKSVRLLLPATLLVLLAPSVAHAYIGPGAGIALGGVGWAVLTAILSGVTLLFTWPLWLLWRRLFSRRPLAPPRFKRVVVLGLDGLDYTLTERMLAEGKLPHMASLRKQGCFKPLGTTLPSISPVAWSSFQTGTNPGKHNIYDFLTPDLNTYAPKLSSVEVRPPRRWLQLGKYRLPLGKADVRLMRKSRPFWNYLGDYGIFSSIIRVPITFPPEKLRGVLLSAMCAPDLRGTQGMFSYYTTAPERPGERIGGEVHRVVRNGNTIRAELIGPESPFRTDRTILKAPFVVTLHGDRATLTIDGARYPLRKDEYTEWIQVRFRAGLGLAVTGSCKFLLLDRGAEFGLYVTPINIDPEGPVMPISSPSVYSIYLTKRQGTFATLGLAEDTWALNEHVLGDQHFLQQCLDADREREKMFFDSLEKVPQGLCVVVFDGTDRLQHMFWRDIDPTHPARSEHPVPEGRNVIEELYKSMDALVGRTMAKCGKDDLLLVISDHGFNGFRRGLDLNRWLEENGYLRLHEGRRDEEHLAGVDWSQTRAFAVGLSGIFLNLQGKYAHGIVAAGEEADKLRAEIAGRLTGLVDPNTGTSAIKRTYITSQVYRGPYKEHAPDLIPGYQRGYRVSWETAIGRTTESVFHDNTKAWSGDHCIDPSLIPGVLFSNQPVQTENVRLMDIGPTILQLFGIPVPAHMDGKEWSVGVPESAVQEQQDKHEPAATGITVRGAIEGPSTRSVSEENGQA